MTSKYTMERRLSAIPKKNVGTNNANHDFIKAADFETAITATGFGKFNWMLLAILIPSSCAQIFEQLGVSYIIPVAHCDLGLTLENKGLVNSMAYAGMISSGFVFGYICDIFGRKKVMVYGYFSMVFFILLAAFSPNFTVLLIAKYFSGFMFTGPFSACASYVSEFHSSAYRSRVHLLRGSFVALASILLPLIAWGILSKSIIIPMIGTYALHSWNIFLMICCLASLTTAVLYSFMPESPKFLMTKGKNEEALAVLARIYSMNSGKPASQYPIAKLVDETENLRDQNGRRKSVKLTVQSIMHSIKPLFHMPHLLHLIHVCSNGFLLLIGLFSIKLWYPQLLQAINDYTLSHNGTSNSLCIMMEDVVNQDQVTTSTECKVNLDNSSVYINAITLSSIQLFSFLAAGTIVNMLGKKTLALILSAISGCSAIALYFATNSTILMSLFPMVLVLGELCGNMQITVTLELFPTNFRTMALSLYLMSARAGIMIGNIIFPYLLKAGCLPPFLFCGLAIISSSVLTSLYPSTENKALK